MKNICRASGLAFRSFLRKVTGELTTDKKFVLSLCLISVFAVLNLYVSYKAIYNKGSYDMMKKIMESGPLSVPEPYYKKPLEIVDPELTIVFPNDSTNLMNHLFYDNYQRKKTATT